jgi:hypothetical protein
MVSLPIAAAKMYCTQLGDGKLTAQKALLIVAICDCRIDYPVAKVSRRKRCFNRANLLVGVILAFDTMLRDSASRVRSLTYI